MRPVRFVLALCLVGGLTTSTALAAPITITFDAGDPIGGLPVGVELSTQYEAVGVTFRTDVPPDIESPNSPDVTWATNTDMTIVSSTGNDVGENGETDLGTPLLVSGNVLRSFDAWFFSEDGDANFRAVFSGPITELSADFADILVPGSTRLLAYNGSTLLATATATVTGQQRLTVTSDQPITSVVFTPGEFGDYVVVDNITFTPVAVPEPASLTLLALSVAGAVRARRRR